MTVTARPTHAAQHPGAPSELTAPADPGSVPTDFRTAMSTLPAGVCVITTADPAGVPSGLTVSTGFSVSVAPPLFGLCVALGARTLPVLLERGAFVANILHGDAQDAAAVFASRASDKFERAGFTSTSSGLPWLAQHAAHAVECTITSATEAGDHLLVIGAVQAVHTNPTPAEAHMLAYGDRAFHRLPRSH
ncbi:flavin reductase family protein [Ruania halotolerans]|uniref:flavin reductase family protein n=1 Tax=Ruania halotolerans TaxID=2897773 RepID=UPI001E3581AA|nr:flavin reductase family protein [Ruania halotolerans]UFU07050.1 flavin reductase family protein [Ruania halotolerans]